MSAEGVLLLAVGAMLIGAAFMASGPILQAAGVFLAPQDPLAPAEAVIAISGNNPERVRTAARLLRDGYARWLILSGSPRSIVEMERLAHDAGISADQILSDPDSTSTLENAYRSAQLMKSQGLRSAILVTSPYHMRRAIILFQDVFAAHDLTVRAHPAEGSIFEADGWWRRPQDREFVIREYAKLLGVVVGIR